MDISISLLENDVCLEYVEFYDSPQNLQFIDNIPIVYQFDNYSLKLNINDDIKDIEISDIIINNKNILFKYDADTRSVKFTNTEKIFSLIYGITDIIVILKIDDYENKVLYSSILTIAIDEKYEETMNSIHEMLDNIYKKNHYLLQSNKKENENNAVSSEREDSLLEQEITMLKNIYEIYNESFVEFYNNPKTKMTSRQYVDDFSKLRNINSSNINFILQHPEELKIYNNTSGIYIKNNYYIPNKTLVNNSEFSNDILENRVIIRFLNTIIIHLESRLYELKKEMSLDISKKYNMNTLKDNYSISFIIIEKYINISYKNYIDELSAIEHNFKMLNIKYQNGLLEDNEYIRNTPQPTSMFLEIHQYRKIYECIVKWFACSDIVVPKQNTILHFYTADKIYEYYSLLNIVDCIINLGFVENANQRVNYQYDIPNYDKYCIENIENTFIFTKGNKDIVLYYQPVIYSSNSITNNNIDLFRVDKSYYTPDFIIKIIETTDTNRIVKYAILDAKWRNRNTLLNKRLDGDFKDTIYKYWGSVLNSKTLQPVDFLWLIQGKDDKSKAKIYYHTRSEISKSIGEYLLYSKGIVTLTPKIGTEELNMLISKLIN